MSSGKTSASAITSSLFNYTSGRWVYNEYKRFAERERIFNVAQLERLAAHAVDRDPEDVMGIQKLGEGAANRAFTVHFKDGFKIVARVPYPSVEPKGLVVASEAATMTFLRSKGIPVPKVFSYACSSDNPAGTEYMFMGFCSGMDLAGMWDDLQETGRSRVVRSLVEVEARLSEIHLPASGSLYFLRDIPANATKVAVDARDADRPDSLYLGPTTDLPFWYGKRSSLNVDRGDAVMDSGAIKEIHYLEQYGRPLLPFNRFQRETFNFEKQLPSIHLDSIQKYLQISKYLIPRDEGLIPPTLRHPDLRPGNIFVSDDLKITALIDWQHSVVQPLFLGCDVPEFLRRPSRFPKDSGSLSNSPKMSEKEQLQSIELSRQSCCHQSYVEITEQQNPSYFEALTYPFTVGRQKIYRLAGEPWQGDNIPLRSSLIFVKQHWSQFCPDTSVPCPITFTQEEEMECLRLDDAEQQGVEQLEEFKRTIGLGPEGWVSNENYDGAKEAIARMKQLSLEQAESEEEITAIRDHWVFDDMDEEEYG
ncbi:hypothetical protein DOTSEDRAFT_129306 [Dothistroma septosporum NZE10]|uniref:Aminoglycoside phosphotransferase domain-containing protein n=1 Tax=Dothistroma septosporum (strain NZE10 / CBS 128990) TaxID=675120 RepID=N1PQV5_DOTSN|nr:hypothetical protein DOTSEDRAFT_129306 [Dothistroma septosporum NZE10]